MTSKLKYKTQKNFDFGPDLDLPDFDFEMPKVKDNRSTISKVGTAALKGARKTLFSTTTLEQVIRRAMPDSYGNGLDLLNEANSSIKSLYDTAAKEFKPTVNQIKQITKRTIPSAEGKLPKSITDKLKDWAAGEKKWGSLSEEAQRANAMSIEIGSIFQTQMQVDAERDKRAVEREYFHQGLEQVRHKQQVGQLDAMRIGIERLASYQDTVTANYQKKSLELQFRQYFATADILATAKKSSVETKAALDAVVKNTALPEFIKLSTHERFKELTRNRFMEEIRDSMFGGTADYIKRFTTNITKSLKEKLQEAANLTNTAADGAAMAQDNMAMNADMGGDPAEDAGDMLGKFGMGLGRHMAMPRVQRFLQKNKRIVQGGEKLRYRIDNAGQLLNAHLQDDSKKWRIGTKNKNIGLNWLKRWFAENAPSVESTVEMGKDSLMSLDKPAHFSQRANKTLVEIIPGLLSHIHREIKVMRTGEDKVGLLSYDFEGNTFKDSKVLGRQLRESIVGDKGRAAVAGRVRSVLDFIEKEGGKLTDEQRQVISQKVTEMGLRRRNTDASVVGRAPAWGKGPEAQKLAKIFQTLLDVDETTGKRRDSVKADTNQRIFSSLVGQIPGDLGDPRARVQALINSGQYDMLREAGIIDKAGNLNRDQILGDMTGQPSYDGGSSDAVTRRRRRKGLRSTVNDASQGGYQSAAYSSSHSGDASDSRVIVENMEGIKNTLRESNIVTQANQMSATLVRIEQAINNAAILLSTSYSAEQMKDAEGKSKKHQRWWNRSVGSLLKGGARGVGSLGKGIFNEAQRTGQRIDKLLTGSFSLTAKVLGSVKDTAVSILGDIYVKGESFPRLSRVKMKAGEYIDQKTGKTIKTLKDIQGTVVDKAGNVVMEAGEIKDAFMKGRGIKGLAGLVGNLGKFGFNQLSAVSERLGGLYGLGFKLGKGMLKGGIRALIPVSDVYVKGESEPIMYRWKFLKGQYFSQKTNKVLNHQKDIDGPVKDQEGNVVLSTEHINRGLVDKNGRDIHFSIGNITGAILKAGAFVVRKGFEAARNISKKLSGAAGAVLDAFSGIFTGFTFQGKKNLEVNKKALDVQREILSLLKERLPGRKKVLGDLDGDGDRDGSYEDMLGRKGNESGKEGGGEASSEQARSLGLFGRIKGGAAALMGMFGGKGKAAEAAKAADGESGLLSTMGASALGGAAASRLGKFGRFGMGALRMAGGAAGAVGRVGMAVGGFALRNTGMLALRAGAAALGLASTPVLLVGLGLTAAYYGYKYLTKKRLSTLSTVRFAQYGFDKSEDDRIAGVFGLEDMLEPFVTIEGGSGKIEESKMKIEDALDLFGVKMSDKTAVNNWKLWFENRFKPVFLGHMAVLKNTHPSLKIKDVDSKLSAPEKLKLLEATALPGINYGFSVAPFAGQKSLIADETSVNAAREIARTELQKEKDNTATTGKNGKPETTLDKIKRNATDVVVGAAAGVGINIGKPNQITAPVKKDANGMPVTQTLTNSANYILLTKGRLDALQSIRFKAYGLKSMDADKVKALIELEAITAPSVSFSRKEVTFNGDAQRILDTVKGFFGISGYRSPSGYSWMQWYQNRFLPTYLAYVQAVYNATGKEDAKSAVQYLEPKDQMSVANAIKGATGSSNGSRVPVWQVTDSPWEDYVLNADPDSVKGNADALVELNKSQVLGETSKVATDQKARISQFKKDNPLKPTGNLFKDILRKAADPLVNRTPYMSVNGSGQGMQAKGDFMSGDVIKHPGAGTGGDINSIAMPGKAGWAGMKGTILSASKAAGVDGKLMAALAGVESSFNPNAGASTSSASGLYQFTSDTWNETIKKYGNKYGIAIGTSPTDARANALLAAEFTKDNIAYLKKYIKRPLTSTDVYMAHFLGRAGAVKFLQADPSEIGAKLLPKAAGSNKNIFYSADGTALTCGEIYKNLTAKLMNHMRQAGINDSEFGGTSDIVGPTLGTSSVIQAPKGGLTLRLQRDPSTDEGTYGRLSLPDGTSFETLELAWRENAAQRSCIPPGKYVCAVKSSAKFGQVYEVQGVPGRSGILIHAGNTAGNVDKGQKSDVSGCILLGMKRDKVGGQIAVVGSKEAMGTFSQKMGGQTFILEVIGSISDQSLAAPGGTTDSIMAVSAGKTEVAANKPSATARGSAAASTAPAITPVSSGPGPTGGYGGSAAAVSAGSSTMSPVRVNPGFKGFSPNYSPSSSESSAQDTASKNALGAGMDSVNKTLRDQLDVQNQLLTLAKQLANQMSMKNSSSAADKSSTSPLTATLPSREAVGAPVDMRRR